MVLMLLFLMIHFFLCSVFRDSCSLTHYSLTLSYSSVCSSACFRLHPVMIPGSLQREFLAAGRFTLVYFHFIAQNQSDGLLWAVTIRRVMWLGYFR